MSVYFVGSGPGDPELLTLKALRLLRQAQVCIHAGSLVDPELLKELPDDCELHDSARMSLDEIITVMKEAHARGLDVIRLHSGEPSIYGAIGEQMAVLDKLGIDYEQVPGISSFQAAAAALKVELTAPEISQTVVLTRSPGRTPLPGEENWLDTFHPHATYCLFLSVDKLQILSTQIAARMGEQCPCAVVFHASRPSQIILRGTLLDIGAKVQAQGIRHTAQVLIGYALGKDLKAVSRLYAPEFGHEFRDAR